jgi:hypothetical protein
MKLQMIVLVAAFGMAPAAGMAQSWSGLLVDSKCYDAEERSVNPNDRLTHVERDQNLEIRMCAPKTNTKSFAVVEHGEDSFKLDAAGNARVSELLKETGKKSFHEVTVVGEMENNTPVVDSISSDR